MVVEGYSIETQDNNQKSIDASAKFSLDTSDFAPYEMLPQAVRFTVGDPTVQKPTAITFSLTTEVPFEYDNCYAKFTFPPEIVVTADMLKAYTGDGYLMGEGGV